MKNRSHDSILLKKKLTMILAYFGLITTFALSQPRKCNYLRTNKAIGQKFLGNV